MPSKRCPYCRRVVPESNWFVHLRGHSDRRRPRKGTAGGWRRARKLALERDGYRCTKCFALGTQRGGTTKLEVHHLDGNWKNNLLVNLATLCDEHHKELRRSLRSV